MAVDEALLIRYALFAIAVAALAYGLWWFLFRKPPRPRQLPIPANDR